jgi:hypothetical protein
MPLPTSGPLSLNDIKGEFGGPTSPSLGDYYAGGTYVPAGTSGTNGAVPSSGTISISNFYGTSSVVVEFFSRFISGTAFSSAEAGYQIVGTTGGGLSAGNDYEFVNFNFPTNPNQWITPTSQAANYEVYATFNGGDTLSGGTLNTWVAVSTNPAWYLNASGSNVYRTTYLGFQVRRIGTSTVLSFWDVELYAGAD